MSFAVQWFLITWLSKPVQVIICFTDETTEA